MMLRRVGMSESIKDIMKPLRDKGIVKCWEIKGCSELKIEKLEKALDIKLPERYKEYLRYCGKGAGAFTQGTDMLYQDVFELYEDAVFLLEENDVDFTLPETAFVFMMHQGYFFTYFDLAEESDDPAVYYYREVVMDKPEKKHESFTDFIRVWRDDTIAYSKS